MGGVGEAKKGKEEGMGQWGSEVRKLGKKVCDAFKRC